MSTMNYLVTQPEMQGLDTASVEQYVHLVTQPHNADASSLAFILILALITGLLFFILFLLFFLMKEQKKSAARIEKFLAEDDRIKIGGVSVDLEEMPKLGGETVAWEEMPKLLTEALKENEELVAGRNELHKQLNRLRKDIERYENAGNEAEVLDHEKADSDAELFVRYFARKQVSASKEGIRFIVENGQLWLDEINALQIANEDSRISLYMLVNTLVEMAKMLMQHDGFLDDVFRRYATFIRNPGVLHVRDVKYDEILFLKNSLELSVLFRDFIRRRNEPEQFQPGKPQNINFEMIASDMSPAQINAPRHNRQFDGSDIPSNLLVYSLICNMYGIDDLNVFISGDRIQKNIR